MTAVRAHLLALFAGFAALAVVFVPLGLLLSDTFWTRALQGLPLTPEEARLLGFDPARFVDVATLAPAERRAVLDRTILLFVASVAVGTPFGLGLYYYQLWILQRVNQLLRLRLLDRLQELSLRFHAGSRIGDAIYRMYQDSAMVTELIRLLFITPVQTASGFLFGLVVVGLYDPWLALLLVCLWPPLLVLGRRFSRPLRVGFRTARERNSALTARIQETLAGVRVLKAYGAEAGAQARFEAESREAFAAAFAARSRFATYQVSLFWCAGVVLIAGAAVGALRTRGAAETFALVLGFHVWTLGLWNYFKLRLGAGAGHAQMPSTGSCTTRPRSPRRCTGSS